MHLTPAHFHNLTYEQIVFFEWLNGELSIQGKRIVDLQSQIDAIGKKEPNIRDTPDLTAMPEVIQARMVNEQAEAFEELLRLRLQLDNATLLVAQYIEERDRVRLALREVANAAEALVEVIRDAGDNPSLYCTGDDVRDAARVVLAKIHEANAVR